MPKALHQNGEMKYAHTERYESRKNVRMIYAEIKALNKSAKD